jgi:hypothetical protein
MNTVVIEPRSKVKSGFFRPILLYPQNAEQVDFFSRTAKQQNVEMVSLSEDDIEDMVLGRLIEEGLKTPRIDRSEIMKILEQ